MKNILGKKDTNVDCLWWRENGNLIAVVGGLFFFFSSPDYEAAEVWRWGVENEYLVQKKLENRMKYVMK